MDAVIAFVSSDVGSLFSMISGTLSVGGLIFICWLQWMSRK